MEDYNENMNYNYNFNQPNGEPHSDPNNQFYTASEENKPIWAAYVSFFLSLANFILCCCCGYITVIAALVFGIISLANKWRGKGFAIAGVVISLIMLIVMLTSQILFRDVAQDFADMIQKTPKYYEEYAETGEIPEEFVKFNDEKYDILWKISGTEDFEEFYSIWMDMYGQTAGVSEDAEKPIGDEDFYTPYENSESSTESTAAEKSDAEFGETPVEL